MCRKSAGALFALAVLLTLLHSFTASAAPPKKKAPAAKPQAPIGPPQPPLMPIDADPDWRQIMMAPAISGNLRAVAVDPTDDKSIYVATAEGTLVHSTDGGVTWAEIALSPFQAKTPTIFFDRPGDHGKAIDIFSGMHVRDGAYIENFNPIARDSATPPEPVLASPPFTQSYISAFRRVTDYPSAASSLMETVAAADPHPYDDIRFIAVCPGGANSLFVVTATKLLGSSDGTNFVELFTARESAPFYQVACNPTDPSEVVITSEDGTFHSTDGGYSFVVIGQVFASAVLFSPPLDDGTALLFLVANGELWIGRASAADEMIAVPTGEGIVVNATITPSSVWVATTQGVRVSRDLGQSWEAIEELEGYAWNRVAVSGGYDGPEQVLALRDEETYISTDGGITFRPSFRAETRRRIRWPIGMPSGPGQGPAFLILTSGGLWTSAVADRTENPKLSEVRGLAMRRLKEMPSLQTLLDRAVVKANLSDVQLDSIERRWRDRGWVPGVQLAFSARTLQTVERTNVAVTAPQSIRRLEPQLFIDASIALTWELPDVAVAPEIVYQRMNLYDIRKRLAFFIEDAYLERRQILGQLATGGLDEEQSLTLQARLEVLDVVLQEFTTDRTKK